MKRTRLVPFLLLTFVTVAFTSAQSTLSQTASAPARAYAAAASTGWSSSRIDRAAVGYGDNRGKYVSAVTKDPVTYVSYYDATNRDLKVARYPYLSGGNCGPNDGWYCRIIDSAGDVGRYSSIAIPPLSVLYGPGIAYYDLTNGRLKFAEYVCQTLPCSWSVSTIHSIALAYVGRYASFKYDTLGGRHIAYQAAGTSGASLMYAHSVSGGGNCGVDSGYGKWQCDVIDSGPGIGAYASLDLNSDDHPRIAYYDSSNGDLRYAMWLGTGTGNCLDNDWWCGKVDSLGDVGRFAYLRFDRTSANIYIAYYDATNGKLKYAHWVGGGGNCGDPYGGFTVWQCDTIDDMGTGLTEAGIAMALDGNSYPNIVYQDASDTMGPAVLKLARPGAAAPGEAHNCGPTSGPSDYTWVCKIIDMGGSDINEGDFVSIAFNSAGLATIAYYESDLYYVTGYLKVLQQVLQFSLPLMRK